MLQFLEYLKSSSGKVPCIKIDDFNTKLKKDHIPLPDAGLDGFVYPLPGPHQSLIARLIHKGYDESGASLAGGGAPRSIL